MRMQKMLTSFKIATATVAGAVIGAAAVQGLHAQAKPKAYSVSEYQKMGELPPDYLTTIRKEIEARHGRNLYTVNGRVIPLAGDAVGTNVAIIEWNNVDDAQAFYNSKAWSDWEPAREKAQKTLRRYIVEAEK
jgi:uncharacterized protein (DUF1330 family)